jgi:hypothetical protein
MEERLTRLENLVYALIKRIDNDKFYSSADVDGVRKSVLDVTPYKETKTAYIGDTEVTFYGVPEGNITIFFDKPYTMEKVADRITLTFDELDEVTDITISIS